MVVDNSFVTIGVDVWQKNCIKGEKLLKETITPFFGSSDWGESPTEYFNTFPSSQNSVSERVICVKN